MDSINQIGEIASGILKYEFDFIEDPVDQQSELYYISGSLSGKIGELNVLLNQDFSFTGADGNPFPRLGEEEASILEVMYIRDYNSRLAKKILRGIYNETTTKSTIVEAADWIELREGDTVIKRSPASLTNSASNRIAMSKDFKALSQEAENKIKDLVYAYNLYGAEPRQVSGSDAPDIDCTLSGTYS